MYIFYEILPMQNLSNDGIVANTCLMYYYRKVSYFNVQTLITFSHTYNFSYTLDDV